MFDRKKLADYLKENGISKVELAKRVGVTEGHVRHIISGVKQPSLATAKAIAVMMGCSIDDLTLDLVEEEE